MAAPSSAGRERLILGDRGGQVPQVGLVHDYLLVLRGAERSFAAMVECWPQAPIYTTLYSPDGTGYRFEGRRITTSYLQRLGPGQARFRALLPLYPRAVERLPVQGHRLLVSSSSAFAHGVRPGPDAVHICYCYTPFRYAWHERDTAVREARRPLRPALRGILERIQRWDIAAAERVTHYIAISAVVRERLAACYGREAGVIHPPVEVERFSIGEPQEFFLIVAELVPHKRVDVALRAARRAERRAIVVGGGPDLGRLQAAFGDVAEFVGRVSDERLAELYSRARALLVPNVEEFGIAAVEAQAAGRPVVAAAAGGVLETVIDGRTGVLLPNGGVDEFAEAMREVDFDRFSPSDATQNAARFSTAKFQTRLKAEVARFAPEPSWLDAE